MKPRILYITPHLPHELSSGGQLRVLHVARALQQVGDVRLFLVPWEEPDREAVQATASEFQIESLVKRDYHKVGGLWRRLRNVMDPRGMTHYGGVIDEAAKHHLAEKMEEFDLIWLYHISTSYGLDRWHLPRSVMDISDVPSTFERTIWQGSNTLRVRLRAWWRMCRWRARERLLAERFDVLAVCSEADRGHLDSTAPVHVIPNGFERPQSPPRRQPAEPTRIGFIGIMKYPPNVEAVRWFVRECWPRIKREVPNARLRLVGGGSEGPIKSEGVDIDGLGWVKDPSEEIGTWSVMIVPVRTGGGTRVKVAEAFSRKCPLVSTRIGAFGYDVTDGRELSLADSPEEFADACIRLIRNPPDATAMAERAWSRFLENWTWDAIAPRVWAAAEDCLTRNPPPLYTQQTR